jgi:hypothetical protein
MCLVILLPVEPVLVHSLLLLLAASAIQNKLLLLIALVVNYSR